MHAGYLVAPGQVEVRQTTVPVADVGGLVVRVAVALTDGTDLKAFRRGHSQMPMPTPFGHEFSGDVAAIGAGMTTFKLGDPLMCVHSAPCGSCYWCDRQQEELCERVMETKILGAYAEYIAVPSHIVLRNAFLKPVQLSYEAAAFLEPLACVVHSFDVLALRPADRLAIVGDGGFGILHALVARALGIARPILIGKRPERIALASTLGIADVIEAGDGVPSQIAARTENRGADAVVECTGVAAVWQTAPALVRRGGTVSLFGGLPSGTDVTFDAARLHYDEVRIVSPFHFTPRAVRRAYELLSGGAIDPRPLISGTFPLDRLSDAFSTLDAGNGIKYAIVP